MKYDCHVEVFDPIKWRPATRSNTDKVATAGELKHFLQAQGAREAVVVQSPGYLGAHGCLLDAVHRVGSDTRAVGHVSRHTQPEEIEALRRRGVCGTRIVLEAQTFDAALDEIAAVHELLPAHWHVELVGSWRWLAQLSAVMAVQPRKFVGVCPELSTAQLLPCDFQRVLWWMEMGNFYLKLVLPERLMGQKTLAALQPQIAQALESVPDRLLWGSGWPRNAAAHGFRPTGGDVSLLSTELGCILDDNAQDMYGFFNLPNRKQGRHAKNC